jgi:hypothetical protein
VIKVIRIRESVSPDEPFLDTEDFVEKFTHLRDEAHERVKEMDELLDSDYHLLYAATLSDRDGGVTVFYLYKKL